MNTMQQLLQFGFQNALVATLLAGGVYLVTRFWRNPLLGRTLWLLVLIKLVTPPLWEMPLPLPTEPTQAQFARIESPTTTATFTQIRATGWIDDGVSRGPAGAFATSSGASNQSPPQSTATRPASEPIHTRPAVQALTVASPDVETTEMATRSNLAAAITRLTDRLGDVSLAPLAVGVWLSGSLLVLLLIAQRTWRFARHLRRCSPAGTAENEAVESLARRIGLHRTPQVRISAAMHPPLVWCLGLQPVLVLPRSLMQQLSGDEQTTVLAHELAHIKRGDHLVRLFEAAVITLFWWHPVVWWARRELQRCEEQCCDADVLRICPDCCETYVGVLVKTVEFLQTRRPVAVAFTSAMAQRHSLLERIERILGDGRPARWSWASRLTAFALLALLPLSIGVGDDAPADVERSDQDPPSAVQPARAPAHDSTTENTTAATVSEELEEQDTPHKRLGDKRPDGSGRVIAARQRQLVPFDRPFGELGFPEGQYGPHWETVRLATHAAVQDELGLTNQQRRQLTPVYTSLMQKDHEWSRGGGDRPNLLKEEYDRARSVLTDEQQQRLDQIIFRRLGFSVFLQPHYAEKIGLSPQQSEQFLQTWKAHIERADKGWDGDEGRQAYHKLQAETYAALTLRQWHRYVDLIGDPLQTEADEPQVFFVYVDKALVGVQQGKTLHPIMVRQDGTLVLPLIPPVAVDGLNLDQVRAKVLAAYGKAGILSADDAVVLSKEPQQQHEEHRPPQQKPLQKAAAPTTLMPEFVNEVLYWLPMDTETLIVSRDFQARAIRDDANWKKSLAEPNFFRTLTRSLAVAPLFDLPPAVQELFTGVQIEWAVLGGRNYEFTSAFGGYRFDGCSVLRFAEPIFAATDGNPDPLAQPLRKALHLAAQDHWRIAQTEVYVFPINKKERESWVKPRTGEGLYLAIHDDHTMILATSDVFLLKTLRRIDGESLDRALPANLPEWNDIVFSAGTWGIRRVPERTPTGEPTSVSSVVWTSIHSDEPDEALAVLYRPRENADLLEGLREQWLQTGDPHSRVIRVVQQVDQRCLVTIEPTANTWKLLPALLFPIQGLPVTSF
jgi:beta-lactamase regulating signal transducer with metallopeptidase domain